MVKDFTFKPADTTSKTPDDTADKKELPIPNTVPSKVQTTNFLERGRDVAGEEPLIQATQSVDGNGAGKLQQKPADAAQEAAQKTTGAAAQPKRKAYMSAYFNNDATIKTGRNQRTRSMRSLRGDQSVFDLKKVVVPISEQVISPDPEDLLQASQHMGLGSSQQILGDALKRHQSWLFKQDTTAEVISQRLVQLEQMVKDRVAALARMQNLPPESLSCSETIKHAMACRQDALSGTVEDKSDVEEERIIHEVLQCTQNRAKSLHRHLLKTLKVVNVNK